ncbi:MAG: hypothetical protein WC372_09800 [Candidatus Neomarinimicrobiota bacterium]|jgi:hypothetical protein
MSKKDFTGGLDSLLGGGMTPQGKADPKPRPGTARKRAEKPPKEATRQPETRATFIIKEETLTRLKAIAYWERVLIKDVINEALEAYLSKYEKTKGNIKPIPGR